MSEIWEREARLIGEASVNELHNKHVAIFGIGGVGGHVVDALARAGVGELSLFDHDTVSESNINRQMVALVSTVGRYKVDVMQERICDINPDAVVHAHQMFFLPENQDTIDFSQFDYVVDAIDTVTGKLSLIECANAAGVPIISAMGAGNKLNPAAFEVADIYKTSVCPLAKVMRRELKVRGVKSLKVVYSKEEPRKPIGENDPASRKVAPGSISFVPAACGLVLAGAVVRDLLGM